MSHEFDHLPGRAIDVWKEQARRSSMSGRYYRQRCRKLAVRVAELEAMNRRLDREISLLEAQVDVLEQTITAYRRGGGRPSEDVD